MKSTFLLLLLSHFFFTTPLEWHSVSADSPKKDEDFSKKLIQVLSAANSDFTSLPRTMESHQYLDTTWDMSKLLPGADEAKLTKNNGASILTVTYSFKEETGLSNLLQKIKASLPEDYVYSVDFDPASHTYDYTFEIDPASKKKHPGYPSYFHLTGDTETAFIFMGRSPAWLSEPK
jgi:hypothetical protein